MAKKKKQILGIAGKTQDDKPVMNNVFKLVGTHGTPLQDVLNYFKDNGLVIDWLDYIEGMLKDGANIETAKARIQACVGEVYGPKYRDEVMKRIEHWYPTEGKL